MFRPFDFGVAIGTTRFVRFVAQFASLEFLKAVTARHNVIIVSEGSLVVSSQLEAILTHKFPSSVVGGTEGRHLSHFGCLGLWPDSPGRTHITPLLFNGGTDRTDRTGTSTRHFFCGCVCARESGMGLFYV